MAHDPTKPNYTENGVLTVLDCDELSQVCLVQFTIQNSGAAAPSDYRLAARFSLRGMPCSILSAVSGQTQAVTIAADNTALFGPLDYDQSVTFSCGMDEITVRQSRQTHIEMNIQ